VGVSLAVPGHAWYFPIGHTIEPEMNMDAGMVLRWLQDVLAGDQPKVGTNLIYDVGWLLEEGVTVNGPLLDIGYAEALLSETASLGLDGMAEKYLGTGKVTNYLYRWCAEWYGGDEHDQRKNIWRSPARLVGPYAEADALLPLQIFEKHKVLLDEQGLLHLFDKECRLIRMLLAMRLQGARVDLDQAERVDAELTTRIDQGQAYLDDLAGAPVRVNAAATIAPVFDNLGIKYPLTPKTEKPSFKSDFLETINHPVAVAIRELRQIVKLRDTFVRSYVMGSEINGRIHCQFHPVRNEEFGARSGRFASSNPNLQNIPSRHPVLAPLIRSVWVPEDGCEWLRYDYSQIEYRLLVHYAVGEGADEARRFYLTVPDTDYHANVQRMLMIKANRDLDRKSTKNINFGFVYGMGKPTLARTLQLPTQVANRIFNDYHTAVPYVRATMEATMDEAQRLGYITTILGRRSRFELWEADEYNTRGKPLTHDLAIRKYGRNIKRAGLHKALNRRLQGSAADMIKLAMLHCYEEGLFEGGQIPLLTVHDELDFSAANPYDPVWGQIGEVMETVLPLRVPVKVDAEVGPNWGTLTDLKGARK
jgi:DNA polymerase I-like protein with 3'-5' exonuclease and polymerase domains